LGHRGYVHEAALYGSDEEFLAAAVPFLRDGVAAGDPVVVAVGEASAALLRASLGDTTGINMSNEVSGGRFANPLHALGSYRDLFTRHAVSGRVGQVRVLGEIPHPGLGQPWEWWARYEATANHAFAPFPVWGLCPYDLRLTPEAVLADVTRSHPYLTTTAGGAHRPNPHYQDPAQFLRGRDRAGLDPLLADPARVEMTDPTPAAARAAVRDATTLTALVRDEVEDMVLAVNEAVTNAATHGRLPVRLRLWTALDRLVATITDIGGGPTDPYAGVLPAADALGGRGLWMMHHLCRHVTFHRDEEGFTLGLVAGTPALDRQSPT